MLADTVQPQRQHKPQEARMKIQVWFCDLCEQEFAVSDIPRETVRCTGGHVVPGRDMLTLTPERSGRLSRYGWPEGMG
jgi:hypothetical protein